MEAAIEQGVSWQININRVWRGMSKKELANLVGCSESKISELEDPEHGLHDIGLLVKVANSFDCALSVKFISYSELAEDSNWLSEADQYAVSYKTEMDEIYE